MTKTIVTHGTGFHIDDLMAVATLLLIYPDAKVVRTRDEEQIKKADIVADTGGVYDPSIGRFDHHQPGGAGVRTNGIPYASFGLVWKEFGERLAGSQEAAEILDVKLCMPIDAIDNGVEISTPVFEGVKEYSLRDYFYSFSGDANTPEEVDNVFMNLLPIAKDLLSREIKSAQDTVREMAEVRRLYDAAPDKRLIIIPESLSWKRVLIPLDALFIVSERLDGKWGVRAVPKKYGSFEVKKPFPESWAGQRDEALAQVSGVSDATFCHNDRWLAVTKTKEGALALAQRVLNT
jgi:uncharacterized UPF0160 family protein